MGISAQAVWTQGEICGWVDMIFVTVGNDFRGFDRLLRKMDEIAPLISGEILIQTGYSQYHPKNTKHFDFISMDKAVECIRNSELVVSHAGIGTIILCKKYGTPILILPRSKARGEHMNDHQAEIAKALEKKEAEHIYVASGEDRLEERILKILKCGERSVPIQNPGRTNLVKVIKEFIDTV